MRTVLKFGGRAVDTGEKVLQIAELISTHKRKGQEIIGVFSAVNGMTDQIFSISESVKKGKQKIINDFLESTRKNHANIIEYSIKRNDLKSQALSTIDGLISEMTNIFNGIVILSEVTPKALDYLLSFGERLIVPIISFMLLDR